MVLNGEQTYLLWSALLLAGKSEYYTQEQREKLKEIAEFITPIKKLFIDQEPF